MVRFIHGDSSVNLAQRTIKGMAWAYLVFFSGRLITLVTTAILARILVPADFGLIGLALLMLSFIEATQDFGVKDAMIYNDDRLRDTADTAFWMNALIGAAQYLLAVLVAPLAARFIDDTRVVLMVRVMALTFIINALGNTHDGLMQKDLRHRLRYLPTLYSSIIKGVVAVVLALAGAGVWSLVVSHVIGAAVRTVAKWMLIDWRPRLLFFADRARSLLSYGVYILALNVLGIALEQADQLMIGTLLGEIQLGYYSIAARIPEMVIANFSIVLTSIVFPAYSKIKNDSDLLAQGFLTTTKYTAFVTVPAGLGMVAVAPELVVIVFGREWEPAIRLMQVLSLMGVMATLPWSVGDIFKATGRPDLSTKLLVIEAVYSFPLIWFFAYHWREAVWVSFANFLTVCASVVLRLGLMTRFLPVTFKTFITIFRGPFIAGAAMYGAVMAWRSSASDLPAILVLLVSIVLGGVVYVGLLYIMERQDIHEKGAFLLEMVRSRGREDGHDELDTIHRLSTSGDV